MLYFFIFLFFLITYNNSSKPIKLSLNSGPDDPIQILFTSGNIHQTRVISFPDNTFAIAHNEKLALLYNDQLNQTSSDYVLNSQNDIIINEFSDSLQYHDINQWKLYIFEDFQSPLTGWNKDTVSACGNNGNLFLGGHCNFANDFVYKTFTNLPLHKEVIYYSCIIYIYNHN